VIRTAPYTCPTCGERIELVIDPSAGADQRFVEDCPVCCRPNVLHVSVDRDGEVFVAAEPE